MINAHVGLPAFLSGVRIAAGETPNSLPGASAKGVLWQASPGRFLIDVPGVARYLVAGGRSVTIDASPQVSRERIAHFLRTAPLAALFYQCDVYACHASAVETPVGALMLTGYSGAGKSTLAAALIARGCRLLADDVVPVALNDEGWPEVLSTSPDIVLWPDAQSQLFPGRLPDWIGPAGHSRNLAVREWEPPLSVKLHGIIRLSSQSNVRVTEERAGPMMRFESATRMLWNSRIANVLLDRGASLAISSAIARFIPVNTMLRSAVRWQAGELADRIMENLG
jgi:hypothetical protein